MTLKSRLHHLERALHARGRTFSIWDFLSKRVSPPEDFDPQRDLDPRHVDFWHRLVTLPSWLATQGFAVATQAVETGVSPPPHLERVLKEQAAVDYYHEVYGYVLTCHLLPDELWGEFVALRKRLGSGPHAPWLEFMPQFRRLATRLREISQGESERLYREDLASRAATAGGVFRQSAS